MRQHTHTHTQTSPCCTNCLHSTHEDSRRLSGCARGCQCWYWQCQQAVELHFHRYYKYCHDDKNHTEGISVTIAVTTVESSGWFRFASSPLSTHLESLVCRSMPTKPQLCSMNSMPISYRLTENWAPVCHLWSQARARARAVERITLPQDLAPFSHMEHLPTPYLPFPFPSHFFFLPLLSLPSLSSMCFSSVLTQVETGPRGSSSYRREKQTWLECVCFGPWRNKMAFVGKVLKEFHICLPNEVMYSVVVCCVTDYLRSLRK